MSRTQDYFDALADTRVSGCVQKASLNERPLLTESHAHALARLFKVLASDTRLRLLHALTRAGELRVTDLADSVGMKPQAVSNQLTQLAERGILDSRRNGNYIFYRIADPCVVTLLDRGWCLVEDNEQRRAR